MPKPRTPKRTAYLADAVHWISEGGSRSRVISTIVAKSKLPHVEAVKLYAEATAEVDATPHRSVGWHSAWLEVLMGKAIANGDMRSALDARRDLAKVQRLGDGEKAATKIPTTKEGLLAHIVGVAERVDAGTIGVAKGQAISQLLQTAIKAVDMDEEEIALIGPRPEVGHGELTAKVCDDIINISSYKRE